MSAKKIPCQVPNCPNLAHSKGWCKRHYSQIHRHGKILSINEERAKRLKRAKGDPLVDRILSAKRELARVSQAYNAAMGPARRIWSEQKQNLELEIATMEQENGAEVIEPPEENISPRKLSTR